MSGSVRIDTDKIRTIESHGFEVIRVRDGITTTYRAKLDETPVFEFKRRDKQWRVATGDLGYVQAPALDKVTEKLVQKVRETAKSWLDALN